MENQEKINGAEAPKETKDYIEMLQRMKAEFENFRKRTEKEKAETIINANRDLISQMLPVLDNFELSLKHNKDQGVLLIYNELKKILEKQGLSVIDSSGIFDPKVHEAIMQVEGNSPGQILEEFSKGYTINNKLLRASKVKITKVDSNE